MKVNFITNLDIGITSGGWGGINFNIYSQLKQYFDVIYVNVEYGLYKNTTK